jgi:hypothetical protein
MIGVNDAQRSIQRPAPPPPPPPPPARRAGAIPIAERDLKVEYDLICRADGGMKVHDDSGWRVVMGCGAETRQHVKINF